MRHLMIAVLVLLITASSGLCKNNSNKKYKSQTTNFYNVHDTPKEWLMFMKKCANKYGVSPYRVLSVAHTESSKGNYDFRFGKVTKFYLPFGVHEYALKERGWRVDDLFVQTEVATRALTRYGTSDQAFKKALKKYNASFNMKYYYRIKYLERYYEKNKIFENLTLVYKK